MHARIGVLGCIEWSDDMHKFESCSVPRHLSSPLLEVEALAVLYRIKIAADPSWKAAKGG
jgi:hypothetical protein